MDDLATYRYRVGCFYCKASQKSSIGRSLYNEGQTHQPQTKCKLKHSKSVSNNRLKCPKHKNRFRLNHAQFNLLPVLIMLMIVTVINQSDFLSCVTSTYTVPDTQYSSWTVYSQQPQGTENIRECVSKIEHVKEIRFNTSSSLFCARDVFDISSYQNNSATKSFPLNYKVIGTINFHRRSDFEPKDWMYRQEFCLESDQTISFLEQNVSINPPLRHPWQQDDPAGFINTLITNQTVVLQSNYECSSYGTGTCYYLLGNKGMHMTNGNPPTKLLPGEAHLTKQTLKLIKDRADESVGYITVGSASGTGFRVCYTYLMSAFHVFSDKIDGLIDQVILQMISLHDKPRDILLSSIKDALELDITVDNAEDFDTTAKRILRKFLTDTANDTERLVTRLKGVFDTDSLVSRLKAEWKSNCHVDFVKHGRFNVDWKIIFGNKEIDIIIVDLHPTEKYQDYPRGMLLDEIYRQHGGIQLIRYNNENPPKIIIDQNCTVFTSDDELQNAVEEAIAWWERNFQLENNVDREHRINFRDEYKDCSKAIDKASGRVILRSSESFKPGSSGSPVIYMLNNEGVPIVEMIYQGGFPPFYYTSKSKRFHGHYIDRKCFFGRATSMKKMSDCLINFQKTELKQLLFSQEGVYESTSINREEGASQTNKDRPQIMLNTVEAWRIKNIYKTKSVEAAKEKISSKGCVCVIGVPGAGKSTALRHAALSLETDGFIVYCVYGLKEFLKYYDMNKKQVFVLDDALGVYSVDQDEVKLWQKQNENVKLTLGTNTKLLVSIRTQIFLYETIRHKEIVFLDKSMTTDHIDFSDADYKLGIDDMRGMLTHYMTAHGVNVDNINKVIEQVWGYTDKELTEMTECNRQRVMSQYTAGVEFSQCFPLLCKIFVNTDFVKKKTRAFFTNPFPALTKVFQNIKIDNKHQFCALVLCTMFDGKLTDDLVGPLNESPLCNDKNKLDKDKQIRNYIMSTYKLKCPEDLEDLQSAVNSLTGVYISHVGNTYKMSHTVFYDIVTYLYNDSWFVFKYGTREFIRDRVQLNKDEQQHDPYVKVYSDNTNIERLADRLFRDWMSDRDTRVQFRPWTWTGSRFIIQNRNIDDDRLISSLRRKLTDRAQTDKTLINDLFIHCMETVDYDRDTYKHGDVTQYKLIQTCLQVGDVDCNQCNDGWYPIEISIMTGSLQLTQLLLKHGADKRIADCCDRSVLHWVCTDTKYNKVELVKLLVQEDLSVVDWEGRTIHDNILTYVDNWGRNILHYSVDDYDLTYHLLTYPSLQEDINKSDEDNRTPCWYIINNKKPDWSIDGTKNIVLKKKTRHDTTV